MIAKLIILMLSACLLLGCQSRPSQPVPHPIDLSWLAEVDNWSGPGESLIQLATFEDRRSGEVRTVRFDVVVSQEALVMVTQSTMGVPLYESIFRNGTLEVVRHLSTLQTLPAEPVVADFLLAHWPIEALTPALSRIGYTLQAQANGRILVNEAGTIQIEMRQAGSNGQTLHITHHDIPLTIRIETLTRQPVP